MRAIMKSLLPADPLNLAFLLVFCAVFAGILAWTLRKRPADYEEAARLPLND